MRGKGFLKTVIACNFSFFIKFFYIEHTYSNLKWFPTFLNLDQYDPQK